jgi:hypothetical protein
MVAVEPVRFLSAAKMKRLRLKLSDEVPPGALQMINAQRHSKRAAYNEGDSDCLARHVLSDHGLADHGLLWIQLTAKAIGISVGSVQRIWRAHKLQPHRLRTFKRSRDPSFATKLTDIVGL